MDDATRQQWTEAIREHNEAERELRLKREQADTRSRSCRFVIALLWRFISREGK